MEEPSKFSSSFLPCMLVSSPGVPATPNSTLSTASYSQPLEKRLDKDFVSPPYDYSNNGSASIAISPIDSTAAVAAESSRSESDVNSQIKRLDNLLEWEERKEETPFWLHSVSGMFAGVAEHLVIYPIDTIKTRLQALTDTPVKSPTAIMESSKLHNIYNPSISRSVWREIYLESGYRGFFRGLPALLTGCLPAHAALFSVYEISKFYFGGSFATNTESSSSSSSFWSLFVSSSMVFPLCGGLATLSHDLILTPTDVVKQRLQLGCYKGVKDCLTSIIRNEGFLGFYRSVPTTLFMNVPFGATLVTVNEFIKAKFELEKRFRAQRERKTLPRKSNSNGADGVVENADGKAWLLPSLLPLYFVSAGIAGGIAGFLTTPLDVIKTRLQTQEVKVGNDK